MNYWEIGSALESAAKTIKEMSLSIITNAVDDVEGQYKAMMKAVTDMQEFSQKCISDLRDMDEAHMNECDRILANVKARREKLKECLKDVSYEELSKVNTLADAVQKLRSINPKDLDLIVDVLHRSAARAALEGE